MFAIEVQSTFSAAHALRLPNGGAEPLHGHDFHVTVKIACTALDALQTVIDFHHLERLLAAVLGPWSNRNLNEIEPFCTRVNPSAERLAEHIGTRLQRSLAAEFPADIAGRGLRLVEVRITEAPNCFAAWSPD